MQLDISRVLKSPDEELPFSFEEVVAAVNDPVTGLSLTGPVIFAGRVRGTGRGGQLTVKGEIKAPVKALCTRCGEPFCRTLEVPVDLLFGPVAEDDTWTPETDTEKAVDYPLQDSRLDLEPVVRDAILLAIPLRMLCRPDCQGCCPHCGAQLNHTSCRCEAELEAEQSPFGKLKDLFK